jgi:predicted short-subunit dehydrogenase-like oxidoreductase (DUF2520 family)
LYSLKSKIIVIGAGKISYSLISTLKRSGFNISTVISRKKSSAKKLAEKFKIQNFSNRLSDIPKDCGIFFLTVPDTELKNLSKEISLLKLNFSESLFVHMSGAEDISALKFLEKKKAAVASLHIMQSFPSKNIVKIQNCYAAVESKNKKGEKFLYSVAKKLKLIPFRIKSENKIFYHLAGVYSSNFLVANLYNTNTLFKKAGVPAINPDELFAPIINCTINSVKKSGVSKALSGPVERGDLDTVKRHIKALRSEMILKENYIRQSLSLIELIRKRDRKLSPRHRDLEKYLKSL